MQGSIIGLGVVAMVIGATQGEASTHHGRHARGHSVSHRAGHHGGTEYAAHKHHEARRAASSSGVTAIPASGVKLSCGRGRSPLMVRKMTQGSGTTVTVICR